MDEQVYTISQAAKAVGESTSVLRYWEDVLEIRVNRNPRGYRCYTGYDIQLFLNIKELKKRGLKLDAIRELIPRIYQYGPGAPRSRTRLLENQEEDILETEEEQREQEEDIQEAEILDEAQILKTENIEENPEDKREPEDFKLAEFQSILEKLIAQGMKEKNQEELRIRKLDEKIRFRQQSLKQVAAAREMKQWRGKGKRGRKH